MNQIIRVACVALGVGASLVRPSFAADKADAVLDGFLAAVKANASYTAEQKEKAAAAVESLRKDPVARASAVAEALRELSPDFSAGLDALADEKYDVAQAKFRPLAKAAEPFTAAEANFQLGRALVMAERYEEALPALAAISGPQAEKSLSVGQALFLRGLCEVALLQRKEAIMSLERFMKEDPDAPERLRIAAWRQVEELKQIKDGSLRDVWLHMDFVRRKLALEDAGQDTRKRQDQVVALLDKLIKEAEERESQGEGSGQAKEGKQGKGQGQNSRSSGGQGGGPDGQKNDKTGPNDQTPFSGGAKRQYKGPQSAWSALRDSERAQVLQALKDKFPERYKQLLEQYYKNVQDEEEP